jgi:hypothetical protein
MIAGVVASQQLAVAVASWTYPYAASLTNPGGESGASAGAVGWTDDLTGSSLRALTAADAAVSGVPPTPRTGTRQLGFATNGTTNDCSAYQDFAIPSSGHTDVDAGDVVAVFSVWGQNKSDDYLGIDMAALNGSGTVLTKYEGDTTEGDNDTWKQRYVAMKLPANTRTIRIWLKVRESFTVADCYFDDCALTFYRYTRAMTLTNPGAESGNITGWTAESGTMVAQTTETAGTPTNVVGPRTGSYYFRMGANVTVTAYQDVAVDAGDHTLIDAGKAVAWGGGYTNGYDQDNDEGQLEIECRSSGGVVLATLTGGYGSGYGVGGGVGTDGGWRRTDVVGAIPANTRTLRFRLRGRRAAGTQNNAYFDDLELHVCEID